MKPHERLRAANAQAGKRTLGAHLQAERWESGGHGRAIVAWVAAFLAIIAVLEWIGP